MVGSCLLAALCLIAAPSQAQSQFNGAWTVSRSLAPGCGPPGGVFTITLRNGAVSAPGGRGSVSASGAVRFPGEANQFTGQLNGNEGSGTYFGRCTGTFSARRN